MVKDIIHKEQEQKETHYLAVIALLVMFGIAALGLGYQKVAPDTELCGTGASLAC